MKYLRDDYEHYYATWLKKWLLKVDGRPKPGDWVSVTRMDGDTKEFAVKEVLWEIEGNHGPQAIVTHVDISRYMAKLHAEEDES